MPKIETKINPNEALAKDLKQKLFESTVRVMDRQNQFKIEWRAPQPTRMGIYGDKMVFDGDPSKQDNSFLKGKAHYEIKIDQIKEIKFNKIWNSAIKITFNENSGERSMFIQWLSPSICKPYNIEMTEECYRRLVEWFT